MLSTGTKIRNLRQRKRLTQKQLSKELGISQAELSRMECNRTSITVEDIKKIAVALGVRSMDLIDEELPS